MLNFINYLKEIKLFNSINNSADKQINSSEDKKIKSSIDNSIEFSIESEDNNLLNNKPKVKFIEDEKIIENNNNQNNDTGIYFNFENIIKSNVYGIPNLVITIITILIMTIKILFNNVKYM